MRIAIVHYHLRRGGVSRVIELACRALRESEFRVAVLAGDIPHDSVISHPTASVSGLDYKNPSWGDARTLQRELEKTASRLLGGPPDLWHVHNHSLGKNSALPEVISSWAKDGQALLLQIHDFAENQRPENYRRLIADENLAFLYPSTSRIAYALLNSRDEQILKQTDFPGQLLHLPNPVVPLVATRQLAPQFFGAETLVVYPCRAIRRKNIGEALLLACTFPKDHACGPQTQHHPPLRITNHPPRTQLALALAPDSRLASYERWKALVCSRRLPVEFDTCTQRNISLGDLVSAAESLLTTSMEEGFGMTFLEAWLSNKPLIGRDIPSITSDFRSAGLVLDSLYGFLGVPVSLIGKEKIKHSLLSRWDEKFSAVGMPIDELLKEKFLHRVLREDQVDFGELELDFQEHIVRIASESPRVAREIISYLPVLPSLETIHRNRQVIESRYALHQYGLQLVSIYENLVSAPSSSVIFGDSQAILKEFLNFYALKMPYNQK